MAGATFLCCLVSKRTYEVSIKEHIGLRGFKIKKLVNFTALSLSFEIILMQLFFIVKAKYSFLASSDSSPDEATMIVSWIAGILVAPVLEEIVCRAIMIETSKKDIGPVIAIITSSAVFALLHLRAPLNSAHTFLGSLLWGYIYIKTNNVLYTIIIHSLTNALLVLIDVLCDLNVPVCVERNGNTFINNYVVIFCCTVIILILTMHFIKKRKKTDKRENVPT